MAISGLRTVLKEDIDELSLLLKNLVDAYRLLVGAANEFNGITLAHKDDLEDAIDRADELGDIIDEVIEILEARLTIYLRLFLLFPLTLDNIFEFTNLDMEVEVEEETGRDVPCMDGIRIEPADDDESPLEAETKPPQQTSTGDEKSSLPQLGSDHDNEHE